MFLQVCTVCGGRLADLQNTAKTNATSKQCWVPTGGSVKCLIWGEVWEATMISWTSSFGTTIKRVPIEEIKDTLDYLSASTDLHAAGGGSDSFWVAVLKNIRLVDVLIICPQADFDDVWSRIFQKRLYVKGIDFRNTFCLRVQDLLIKIQVNVNGYL